MKIYDCFTFYNEYDLLELRLEELWDTVDYFVIAEANQTFRGNLKKFNLEEHWSRFEKYSEKIRYIKVYDMPAGDNAWQREFHQRSSLDRGLFDLKSEDLVIVSDSDEIPRPSSIKYIKEDSPENVRYCLCHPIFYFKLNYLLVKPLSRQINIKATRAKAYMGAKLERDCFNYIPGTIELEHAGWHWTYFGDSDFARIKIKSFSHSETDIPKIVDNIDVEKMIEQECGLGWDTNQESFKKINVDSYYPRTITQNLEKYKKFIAENATHSIYDFYPKN